MLGARFERFVYGVAGLGAFALIALTLFSGLQPAAIAPTLAELAPADSVVLIGLRLETVRATPLWQRILATAPAAQLEVLARETGFDFRSDLDEVLLAWNGNQALVLIRGNFRRAEVEANLERGGGNRMPHLGWTLIGNEDHAVAFLDGSHTVAGPAPLVRAALERRGHPPAAPTPLLAQAREIAGNNQVWMVAAGGIGRLARNLPRGALSDFPRPVLDLVEALSIGIDFRSGLGATALLGCRGEQDAATLANTMRGGLQMGRLETPGNDPDLLRILDGIQVSQERWSVRVRVHFAQDLMERLLAKR